MNEDIPFPRRSEQQQQQTDSVREFFTALLATILVFTGTFGIVGKLSGKFNSRTFAQRELVQTTPNAKSSSREYSQDAAPGSGISAYDSLIEELNAGNTPSAELYVDAAKELLVRGAGSDAKAIIAAGQNAYPDDPVMVFGVIDVKAATGSAEEAWDTLAQTGDTSNPEVMSRLIQYATAAGKVDETMVILGDLSNLPWTPTTQDWSNLVNMLTEAGRVDEAKEAAQYSPEADQLDEKLDAIAKLNGGDYEAAKDQLEAYIDSIKNPTPEDWALLGETYEALGDALKAAEAYREAEGLKAKNLGGNGNGNGNGGGGFPLSSQL